MRIFCWRITASWRLVPPGRGPVPARVIDASGKIIAPGFVNTHHHTFQSLVRNIHIANGLTLEPWLMVVYDIFREIDPELVRAGALVGLGDLLKTGCTTSSDQYCMSIPRAPTG